MTGSIGLCKSKSKMELLCIQGKVTDENEDEDFENAGDIRSSQWVIRRLEESDEGEMQRWWSVEDRGEAATCKGEGRAEQGREGEPSAEGDA
jgi:hypothetical protein